MPEADATLAVSFVLMFLIKCTDMFLKRLASALRNQDWPTVFVEFFLVVTGVLLALQLDNWNELRKDRALFLEYVAQMAEDLRFDIEQAKFRIERTDLHDEQAAFLQSVIQGRTPEPIDDDVLVSAILVAGYANLNLVRSHTYDEMSSTGNLRLFPDTDLKRQVVAYYSYSEIGRQWNALIQSVQIDYRRETRDLLSAEQFRWARRNIRNSSTDAPPVDMQQFREKTTNNTELMGVISAMAEVHERIRYDSRDTAKHAQALLARLAKLTNTEL